MTLAELKSRMKRFQQSAEIIFDSEEPVGTATDLVMPRRRWFRRGAEAVKGAHGFPPSPKRS